jgi:phage portal protein BeeE
LPAAIRVADHGLNGWKSWPCNGPLDGRYSPEVFSSLACCPIDRTITLGHAGLNLEGKDADDAHDFEIIAAPRSDLQWLQRSVSTSAGWAGLLRNLHGQGSDAQRIAERGSYSQVAVVYACVRARADALGMMPLRVGKYEDQIIETGPLAQLAQHPSHGLSARQFWRATESHLLLFGRAHWLLETLPGGQVTGVRPLNPLAMTYQLSANGELLGWLYTPPGSGRQMLLGMDEVHSLIDPDFENPECPLDGLSPRRAAMMAIAQYHTADQANQSSLNHGVAPDGVLTVPGNLTEEQQRRMLEQLNERHKGPLNRQRLMIAEGGMTFTPM